MENQSKLCKKCTKEFFRNASHSSKYWEKREFCSVSCSLIGRPAYFKGKNLSEETKRKISESKKGTPSWNKGLTTETDERVKELGKKSGDSRINKPRKPFRMLSKYKWIMAPEHPRANGSKVVMEQIIIMEKHLGRFLTKEEVVHHRNEIKTDNRIENLQLFANKAEHMRYHAMNSPDNGLYKSHVHGRIHSKENRKKISETLKNKKYLSNR